MPMMPSTPEPPFQPSCGISKTASRQLDGLVHDVRILLDELHWYLSRDWQQIIRDPAIAKALIRRSTKAALLGEDIQTNFMHHLRSVQTDETAAPQRNGSEAKAQHPQQLIRLLETPTASPDEPEYPPRVTQIPVSGDRVELYDF